MYNFTRGQMPVRSFTKGQFTKYQLTGTYDEAVVPVEEDLRGGGGGGAWKLIETQIEAFVHDDDGVQLWLVTDSDYEFGSAAKAEKVQPKAFVCDSGIDFSVALESEANWGSIREGEQRFAISTDSDVEYHSVLPALQKEAEEILFLLAMINSDDD